jgi:hypothetical protein
MKGGVVTRAAALFMAVVISSRVVVTVSVSLEATDALLLATTP